ncbi:hypothetical protein CHS0354_011576 [Potamilus streckersoni]|uniref:EF-hand domain-containing protein n=1 Tax=Potamilus streckersoni TaxID=2493646 RepID=A0AAE0RRH0_9BIVA|nr:hypothetical protein CHS0354_011576 [Potamilus streckersoni]
MSKVSRKQLKEFKKTFDMFDKDQNGKISGSELSQAFRLQGQYLSDKEISQIIREVDKDGNGQIDFEEFVSLMTCKCREISKEEAEMREAFKVFDRNGDGKISCKELRSVLQSIGETMTEAEFRDLMREADLDGDGSISYEEFSKVLAYKLS